MTYNKIYAHVIKYRARQVYNYKHLNSEADVPPSLAAANHTMRDLKYDNNHLSNIFWNDFFTRSPVGRKNPK